MTVRLLDWDSEFFGLRIGQVDLARHVALPDLHDLDTSAAELRLNCLYLKLEQPAQPEVAMQLQEHGAHLADVALTLAAPAPPGRSPGSVRSADIDDLAEVESGVEHLAPWSRFAADPRFGLEHAREMYRVWLRRAQAAPDELLAVTGSPGEVTGFIAVAARPTPSIGLLSVVDGGKGLGADLIAAARGWAAERADTLETVTQARNAPALRFYEGHGFRVVRSTYVFHRWYTDQESASR